MKKDALGSRMKANYEDRYRLYLTRRTPVIIRLDGKAFHTFTRGYEKPFSAPLRDAMMLTAMALCGQIQGAKCAYVQSDEISILLTDFDRLETEAWFDYNVQKMVSISAAMASVYFSMHLNDAACFDSRAFNVPEAEVCNYFVWRQKDWIRNSVSMLAQAHFSHRELQGKNQQAMLGMLNEKGVQWEALTPGLKNGTFVVKRLDGLWISHNSVVFTEDRNVIEHFLTI